MQRASLFLKVELELDEDDHFERIGEEICRQILKMYGVRRAELSNITTDGD
jgi:hypothetical protein